MLSSQPQGHQLFMQPDMGVHSAFSQLTLTQALSFAACFSGWSNEQWCAP